MTDVSVYAEPLQRLLRARGWECSARRFTVCAVEPALEPIEHVWMAGKADAIADAEIKQVRPTRIIVPNLTPKTQVARLGSVMTEIGRVPRVTAFTPFVDFLWDAPRAVQRALLDSDLQDSLPGDVSPVVATPDGRHVKQHIRLDRADVADGRLLDSALRADGSWLAVLADAGIGKSELLRWHQWRYAVLYNSAKVQNADTLPPVALRVPLRGMRMLSLESIAHYLSRPDEQNGLPALRRIDTPAYLLELLRMQRIVLLLDGVDELMISGDRLNEGLRELRRAASDGGRIVLSARLGHLTATTSIRASFKRSEVAQILPMTPDAGLELLIRYGATEDRAKEVVNLLATSPAQGIPLFLLMTHAVGLTNSFDQTILTSRTKVLWELLKLFCQREEPRLGVMMDEQITKLTLLALWTNLFGELDESNALELLGIGRTEPSAAVILSPHALLTSSSQGVIHFKYPQFYALFVARALFEEWRLRGLEPALDAMRSNKLEESTTENLARFLEADDIAQAWATAVGAAYLRFPLIRRNILALALARLEDELPGGSRVERAQRLASILGSKCLTDVSISGLIITRLDLNGWTIRNLQGRGGAIQYCSLNRCDYDETVASVDNLDGTVLPQEIDTDSRISGGADRLRRILRPLRRKGSTALVNMITLEECGDLDGWAIIRRAGLADQQRRFGGGVRYWVLNDVGTRILGKFASMDADSVPVERMIEGNQALRRLLIDLGK